MAYGQKSRIKVATSFNPRLASKPPMRRVTCSLAPCRRVLAIVLDSDQSRVHHVDLAENLDTFADCSAPLASLLDPPIGNTYLKNCGSQAMIRLRRGHDWHQSGPIRFILHETATPTTPATTTTPTTPPPPPTTPHHPPPHTKEDAGGDGKC